MFGSLSEEVVALRKAATHVEYIKSGIKPAKSSTPKKGIDRERNIVNMYNNNYTIDDIWRSAASGAAARCSAYSTNMGWSWTVASSADHLARENQRMILKMNLRTNNEKNKKGLLCQNQQ